ncbi:hypothetical protein ACHAW5_008016 [Stephanodiscus triporus]|uniref:Uncharacterized protein n=1 Tax=Stephanodiscus triporus TaxID=2934178 RepID=A0ABD3P8F7_9STRA
MARSLSRGRFDRWGDHISSGPESNSDSYGGGHMETLRPLRKLTYTPRGGTTLGPYSTPPRSPLDRKHYDYPDHRDPVSEGRTFGGVRSGSGATRESPGGYLRAFDDDQDDRDPSESRHQALDVLSRMRSGGITASRSPLLRAPSPRGDRRGGAVLLDREDDIGTTTYDGVELSRYEILGMMEDLKMKGKQVSLLRREITEAEMKHEEEVSNLNREMNQMQARHEEEVSNLNREMNQMQVMHEEDVASVRTKLVSTFKEDMQDMKTEWEDAFQRLKDESDARQRAMEGELKDSARAKSDAEAQLAEHRTVIEEERRRFTEEMEDLKKSKEEDLERLRSMYEEHLNGLKEDTKMLLEENEKVKSDLEELNSEYDKALKASVRWEKEALNLKGELNNVCDENDNYARHCEALEEKQTRLEREYDAAKDEWERHRLTQAEKTRLEKELNTAVKERDEAMAGYDDLVKKLDEIQEERTLESRYTEALVKQRDNMNAIIESTQQEMEELKSMIKELSGLNNQYAELGKEFNLPLGNPSSIRDELLKADKMKERLELLSKERERYNATVKALKVDLRILHGGNVGAETSLQEHMRLLNEKWETNDSHLKQVDKLKSELESSVQLLEENAKERAEHHDRVSRLEKDLGEAQTVLVKMERDQFSLNSELTSLREVEKKCEKLQDAMNKMKDINEGLQKKLEKAYYDHEETQRELTKKCEKLQDTMNKMKDINEGLQKKLEKAYYDHEATQRELTSQIQTFELELSVLSQEKDAMESQEAEIKRLKEMLNRSRKIQSQDMEDAQNEVAESYKLQVRLMEEKHADQDRRNKKKIEELESALNELKESLDQKSMTEIKRRGEFAKQRQELEILRSKERHLETHVNQLEEHISKVVADYEAKLQCSSQTICSNGSDEEVKATKNQVRELEKKLEVTSAAMKQLGKNSLLMEKENKRLKNDKNELKSKLRKLVDCAEKFGPK